jgi:hypothetical protein
VESEIKDDYAAKEGTIKSEFNIPKKEKEDWELNFENDILETDLSQFGDTFKPSGGLSQQDKEVFRQINPRYVKYGF